MRWDRLILSAGQESVTVRFHPSLTVVIADDPIEREGLTSELIGALAGPRPGTNLELTTQAGRRLAILRPAWGFGDRVLDVGTGDDCVTDYPGADLLGMDATAGRRLMRLGSLDVLAPLEQERLVSALAELRQDVLWGSARKLAAARSRLEEVAAANGATIGDTEVIAAVDARHAEFERAQDRCDSIRHHGIFTGVACAVGGIPALVLNRVAAVPFVAVAAVFTALSMVFRRRMERARIAEESALRDAGASSYGGFIHHRVASLLVRQEDRRQQISAAVAEARRAEAAWVALVGNVDLEWALAHQTEVVGEAARGGDRDAVALAHTMHRADPRGLAELILHRVDELDERPEPLPLILDEPFEGMERATVRSLLELLVRIAGHPQVILMTGDPDIALWAGAEELAGEAAVIAMAPRTEASPPDTGTRLRARAAP